MTKPVHNFSQVEERYNSYLALFITTLMFAAILWEFLEKIVKKINKKYQHYNFLRSIRELKNKTQEKMLNLIQTTPVKVKRKPVRDTSIEVLDDYAIGKDSPAIIKFRKKEASRKNQTEKVKEAIATRRQEKLAQKRQQEAHKSENLKKELREHQEVRLETKINKSLAITADPEKYKKLKKKKKTKEQIRSHLNVLTSIELLDDNSDIALVRACVFIFNVYRFMAASLEANPNDRPLRDIRNRFAHGIINLNVDYNCLISTKKTFVETYTKNRDFLRNYKTNPTNACALKTVWERAELFANISDQGEDFNNKEIINWLINIAMPFFNYLGDSFQNSAYKQREVKESLYLVVLVMGEFADGESRKYLAGDLSFEMRKFLEDAREIRNKLAHNVYTPKKTEMDALLAASKSINSTSKRVIEMNSIFRPKKLIAIQDAQGLCLPSGSRSLAI